MNYLLALAGWVLLQAAWQTCAVALLLAVCLRRMRGASAALRYRYAVGCLVAALATVGLTLLASHAGIAAGFAQSAGHLRNSGMPALLDRSLPLLQAAAGVWLGGIAAAQLALALQWMRLRRFLGASSPAGPALTAAVRELCAEIGLAPAPEVRCADVGSPLVAGCRPAFLLTPRRFAESYAPAEIRALLAHELAHIQRHDYSANLRHLCVASLLWWHPAVWLIYARIRHERECSTDERAVCIIGAPLPLAQALVRLAGHCSAGPAAVAAHSGGLADRVARLGALQQQLRGDRRPRFLPGALAALACTMAAAGFAAAHRDALTRAYAASGASPATVVTIQACDPAGPFQVRMVRGRVTAIDLGAAPVPSGQVRQSGETVRVVGPRGEELLRLEVDPRGGLRWRARRAS